ncbi:hypothetical protein CH35J_004876 [Colletotrichum higginsianum]|uniref:Uncharacterized protein n=1 Tax=Colletotrichum higginsianum TaxID=80884 RepID=A0A4T0W8E8_9PEZI|nr:hypothetical protein CH35J_004876 [Colletotrichum higginsianum]
MELDEKYARAAERRFTTGSYQHSSSNLHQPAGSSSSSSHPSKQAGGQTPPSGERLAKWQRPNAVSDDDDDDDNDSININTNSQARHQGPLPHPADTSHRVSYVQVNNRNTSNYHVQNVHHQGRQEGGNSDSSYSHRIKDNQGTPHHHHQHHCPAALATEGFAARLLHAVVFAISRVILQPALWFVDRVGLPIGLAILIFAALLQFSMLALTHAPVIGSYIPVPTDVLCVSMGVLCRAGDGCGSGSGGGSSGGNTPGQHRNPATTSWHVPPLTAVRPVNRTMPPSLRLSVPGLDMLADLSADIEVPPSGRDIFNHAHFLKVQQEKQLELHEIRQKVKTTNEMVYAALMGAATRAARLRQHQQQQSSTSIDSLVPSWWSRLAGSIDKKARRQAQRQTKDVRSILNAHRVARAALLDSGLFEHRLTNEYDSSICRLRDNARRESEQSIRVKKHNAAQSKTVRDMNSNNNNNNNNNNDEDDNENNDSNGNSWFDTHRKALLVCEGSRFVLARVEGLVRNVNADIAWLGMAVNRLDGVQKQLDDRELGSADVTDLELEVVTIAEEYRTYLVEKYYEKTPVVSGSAEY